MNGAHLQAATLDAAQLYHARLDGSDLRGASLKSTKLQLADLTDAHLEAANLDEAQLHGAKLNRSDFRGASLKAAQLHGADLSEAHLEGASLVSANIWHVTHDQSAPHLCDLRSVIATNLEVKKVIDAAVKDTSGSFAETLKNDLGFMLGADGAKEDEKNEEQDPWVLSGEKQNVSDETYLKDLADFIFELGCDNANSPYVARGLIVNKRIQDLGSYAEEIEKSCQGAAGLTSADKRLLHEPGSSSADQKRD